jgi:hypothetical protein
MFAALLPLILPLVIHLIDLASPAEAEELRQKLNAAVDRRKAAVARNEALDAPQDETPMT